LSEWFTTEIDKEFYNNMRMAVIAVWTIWGCNMVELSHTLLITLQVRPEVIGNLIGMRDISHRRIMFLLWDIDEFRQFAVRLLSFRFSGGMWC